jgi:dimethylhistidine N-methyltransferase
MSTLVRKPRARAVSDAEREFAEDVLAGLSAEPKRVPPKYFYDKRGSQLFERITKLPEYYPTRTEFGILEANGDAMAKLIPADAAVIEFGAGSAAKTRILLRAAPQVTTYVPIDISGAFLADMAGKIRRDLPGLRVLPVEADFTKPLTLPPALGARPRVGFFPGSTLGNFEPHEASALLRHAVALLGPRALFLIGLDLVKEADVLNAAYNDASGVTAAFNLNLLERINRELGGDFDLSTFRHHAFYNQERRRIEMHLVSLVRQRVHVCGKAIDFRRGETIHTENSYKFAVEPFLTHASGAGWTHVASWLDARGYFAVLALRASDTEGRRVAAV